MIDYGPHKIKRTVLSTTVAELYAFTKRYGSAQVYGELWMDMTAESAEVHLRADAINLAGIAAPTRLPEQKETIHIIHMIQMLRQEACSGQMHDLAHVLTQYCHADPLTKKSVSPSLLISTVQTGVLREVDAHPPFRSTVQHKAFSLMSSIQIQRQLKTIGHTQCVGRSSSQNRKDATVMCLRSCTKEVKPPSDFLTGRCYIYAVDPSGTLHIDYQYSP